MLNIRFLQILLTLSVALSILYVWGFFERFHLFTGDYDYHVRQSLSLIKGLTYLPLDINTTHPERLGGDLHFYNGVYYSAWGLGIPFLQLPFHYMSMMIFDEIFPSTIIFIVFACVTALILFKFFTRYQSSMSSFIATLIVIYFSLYWLIAYRFLVYEQTTAYFSLFIINALVYFIKLEEDKDKKNIPFLVLNLFIAIMIRPTGIFIALFFFLYLFVKHKSYLVDYVKFFFLPALIFMFFAYEKSGGIFPAGIGTIHAGIKDELFYNRIGAPCYPGTTIDIYLERFLQFFRAFFITHHIYGKEVTDPNCILILEDMIGLNKPWISPIVGIILLASWVVILLSKKYIELIFILSGFITTLLLYTFLANGAAYRYSVDFYFYILLSIFLLYRSDFYKKIFMMKNIKILFGSILLFYIYVFSTIIAENYSSAHLVSRDKLEYNKLTWTYSSAFPYTRYCKEKPIDKTEYDMMGWSVNCNVEKFINTYIKLPNDKGEYKLVITGKNLPEIFTVRINGKLYKSFNHKNDTIYINKIINNAFNIFIYNETLKKNVFIDKVTIR
ncbi:MAG: hypothetical protein VX096_04070 [Pseudomonadota bacterium]|nr:hypothetical protein [Pseudomonadota bacterium]